MFIVLLLLYPVAIQYQRGGAWRLLYPVTALALALDIWANYTELTIIMWDAPRPLEYTFSERLERLIFDYGWRGNVARITAAYLNFFMPHHIKNYS